MPSSLLAQIPADEPQLMDDSQEIEGDDCNGSMQPSLFKHDIELNTHLKIWTYDGILLGHSSISEGLVAL